MPTPPAVRRPERGNMLLLCSALVALLVTAIGAAFGLYNLVSDQKKLEVRSENLALEAAQILNYHNSAGRLNNLQRGARESVFTAREMAEKCQEERLSELAPLAEQILAEARESAQLVQANRKKFVRFQDDKLQALLTANPQIDSLEIGSLGSSKRCGRELSSVKVSNENSALNAYDEQQGYIQKGKVLDLYKSTINLKLPAPDNDLDFILSTLPAAVKGTPAPLRLTTSTLEPYLSLRLHGVDTGNHLKCSAPAVHIEMKATNQKGLFFFGQDNQVSTASAGTACANGAEPEVENRDD
ncbi:MAG: hypothetical protein KGS72_06365 [Cyanobacteria bacterium REEB67]|nr:hypothetical protein [Cyanobacteria bacterium REEB67]